MEILSLGHRKLGLLITTPDGSSVISSNLIGILLIFPIFTIKMTCQTCAPVHYLSSVYILLENKHTNLKSLPFILSTSTIRVFLNPLVHLRPIIHKTTSPSKTKPQPRTTSRLVPPRVPPSLLEVYPDSSTPITNKKGKGRERKKEKKRRGN